ncbi:MAG: ABC transporter ATP-binding protein [Coriobacteriia bacterium]
MLKRLGLFLAEYLRINAIRRMLAIVDVRWSEIAGLVGLAVLFAVFEGVGLSLLLPILQYAEGGEAALASSSGAVWTVVRVAADTLHVPLNLPVMLLLAFTPVLLRQVVFYYNAWYSAVVSSRIGLRMRMQTLRTIVDADLEFFTRHSSGEIVGIVVAQTGVAGNAILAVIRQLSLVLMMLLYLGILFAISAPLTLLSAGFALAISLIIRRNMAKIRDFGIRAARVSQDMMSKIVERISLIRLVKLRHQKEAETERINDFSEEMRAIGIKQSRLGARIEVTADPLLMLSVFLTLYVGISVFEMSLAELGLLMFILGRLNAKVKEFNGGMQAISTNMSGLLLVKEMTDEAELANTIRGGSTEFPGLRDGIRFDNVSFAYPDRIGRDGSIVSHGAMVLHEISLDVPAGSFTALVGRSGAGKSTIVELLPRLRDVSDGTIRFDGVDIKDFSLGSLRRGVGYLTQNPLLFNDSVRENLLYGLEREPTEEQLRSALERAYATFVYDLPEGLETRIGDQGVRFSGGERQRISLARVLLADTPILILDEPTSALDSESEAYIQKALARLHGEKTIVVIAHRLATVIQADQLLVVDQGRVVERGTHSELVAHDGPYHKLFETQLLA